MIARIQSRTARWLYPPVLLLLPLTALCNHLLGFRRMYRSMGRLAAFASRWIQPPADPAAQARQLAQTVIRSNRHISFYQASCLTESLLLWTMLQSCGIDARFYLGVRTITGPLDAHAWVSHRNTVLNDIASVQRIYAAFDLDPFTPGANPK